MVDILFVHGWPLSGATWKRVAEQLPQHRCHLLDLPGSPPTELDADVDLTTSGLASWVMARADASGLRSYALVAFDSGAVIARLVAAQDARVSALVLSNTEVPHHRPPWIELYQRLFALPGAARVLPVVLGWQAYLRSSAAFGNCYNDRRRIDADFIRTFIAPLRRPHAIAAAIRFLRAFDYAEVDRLAEVHQRIRAPVHLVWGADDVTFPGHLLDALAQSFPTLASVTTLPGKLFVHDEQPVAYAERIRIALAESPG